jgi:hypothetical protein
VEEIRFDILHPDTRREQIVVCAARATLGTGAHCDVRLAVDQAAFEHVIVELQADGMRVQNLAPQAPAALNGALFQMATVGQQAALVVGATRIQITRTAVGAAAAKPKLGPGTLARAAALIAIPLALYAVGKRPKAEAEAPDDMPQIFASEVPKCPRTDPGEAKVLADDQRALADAARERSPFEPEESIAAVTAYETAHACFRIGGAQAEAAEALAAADEIRENTLVDFRVRRLRLERALRTRDYEVASQDVAVLRDLTGARPSEYATWLGDVDRQLRAQKSSNER